jgi:hypothetical protein
MKTLPFKRTIDGFVWSGLYELEPYEPADGEFPALLPICTVISLFLNNGTLDLYEVINPAIVQIIEAQLEKEAMP